jgi:beta-galactosidase
VCQFPCLRLQRVILVLIALSGALGSPCLAGTVASLPNGTGSPDAVVLDDSWRLWLDTKASWQNDKLYLPDEVDLTKLPVNSPTGGWDILTDQVGIAVTLPSTVEEHYWGKDPLPTANPSNLRDKVSLDSPYKGVSWWYRTFTPPALQPKERLVFSFLGARLRAEVYVNGQLVGYNCVTEIPFVVDATPALKAGEPNQIAIRITNPGGTFSWGDFGLTKWGDYAYPESHGFGGISGGLTMAVRGPVEIDDLYVANHPDPHTVTLNAEVASTGPAYQGPVSFEIVDEKNGKQVWTGEAQVNVPAGGRGTISTDATVPDADLWDVGHPALYRAMAHLPSVAHSDRLTDFGFRWFNAEDIGSNPRLELNGRRIFVSSAISWGYWAPNGMFPDKDAVQREVDAVHAFGMNCVQTHRHFPKAAVLDAFDHAGLLRYCEPGGGSAIWDETLNMSDPPGPIDPSGKGGEPTSFANRYEFAKLMAMVKAYRSHPSVILWSVNNETGASGRKPKAMYAMRQVHDLDPSRIVVLKSDGPGGEVMARPYMPELFYQEDNPHHDSGWDDRHNEDDTGVYQDSLYLNPTNFKCYTTDTNGIAMWGELGTANSPDDDAATVKWYEDHDTTGYNLEAAKARLKLYDSFLDKYQFRSAFPTAADLFHAVGQRHYFAAAKIVENARMCDANDYIALTGWESTTIDNNSGIVDALRHLKSDPALLLQANAPALLVVRPRHYVLARGNQAVVDVFSINEVNRQGPFTLHFKAAMDAAKDQPVYQTSFPVNLTGGKVFGELLKDNITFPVPTAGPVTMTAWLTAPNDSTPLVQRTEPLLAVDPNPAPLTKTIACVDTDGTLQAAVQKQFGVTCVPLDSNTKAEVIVVSTGGTPRHTWTTNSDPNNPHNLANIDNPQNTNDPDLYRHQYVGEKGDVLRYSGFAPGDLTVELFFAEPEFSEAGKRVFNVALNGQVVLKDFDISAEAGGKGKALVKKFNVSSPDGTLDLSVPDVAQGHPLFAGIRVTDSQGKQKRGAFSKDNYHDATGAEWHSVGDWNDGNANGMLAGFDWGTLAPTLLDQVKNGARLVVLGMDSPDIGALAKILADQGLLTYSGLTGFDDTPWIGHWYFCHKHWLLDGLPSDCVLDWQYQAAAGGNGFEIDAPGLDAVVGYGKNQSGLGIGAAVLPVGQGQIILLGIGGLNPAFIQGDPTGFVPATATRIVYNALHGP